MLLLTNSCQYRGNLKSLALISRLKSTSELTSLTTMSTYLIPCSTCSNTPVQCCRALRAAKVHTDTVKVSLLGVDSLWSDCTFIPGVIVVDLCYFALFEDFSLYVKIIKSVKVFPFSF